MDFNIKLTSGARISIHSVGELAVSGTLASHKQQYDLMANCCQEMCECFPNGYIGALVLITQTGMSCLADKQIQRLITAFTPLLTGYKETQAEFNLSVAVLCSLGEAEAYRVANGGSSEIQAILDLAVTIIDYQAKLIQKGREFHVSFHQQAMLEKVFSRLHHLQTTVMWHHLCHTLNNPGSPLKDILTSALFQTRLRT